MTTPQIPLTISEADLEDLVIDYAKLMKWHVTHFRPAQIRAGKWVTPLKGHPGAPDLILARGGAVLLVELKRHGKHPTPAQRGWLDAIGMIGRVWTPDNWNSGEIVRTLRHHGRPLLASAPPDRALHSHGD
jgi:hypothetical protein